MRERNQQSFHVADQTGTKPKAPVLHKRTGAGWCLIGSMAALRTLLPLGFLVYDMGKMLAVPIIWAQQNFGK